MNETVLTIPYKTGVGRIKEIQSWLKEFNVKHGPTTKDENGWTFTIYNDNDQTTAMAIKLLAY